jgi:hypothetical protein
MSYDMNFEGYGKCTQTQVVKTLPFLRLALFQDVTMVKRLM